MQIIFNKTRATNSKNKAIGWSLSAILFSIAFIAVPLRQMHGLSYMPGDLGDARLNNYFLENIYKFLSGQSDSLWNLGFFYPFPYVLGFSDNLFGSSPVYLLARLLGVKPDTAFQVWFLAGYVANFAAAYYALRYLGGSRLASSIGAIVFTFALPTTAHAGHAQLHYRFGVPLASVFFIDFLLRKKFGLFTISGAWLVWQFYCGIYMGFFTFFLILVLTGTHFIYSLYSEEDSPVRFFRKFVFEWDALSKKNRVVLIFCNFIFIFALVLLFYPYLRVSLLYSLKRSWDEIEVMLPRPQSYFLSDGSLVWSSLSSRIFPNGPMRHEHQMFVGLIPMLLAVLGVMTNFIQTTSRRLFAFMLGAILGMVGLTLYIKGFSFWYFLHKLPLASAIRAVTRIDQVLLFPVAALIVIGIDNIYKRWQRETLVVLAILVPLMIFEFSATTMLVSSKAEWRKRLEVTGSAVRGPFPEGSILFIAQGSGPYYADEIDAMWVSSGRMLRTLNGYSGHVPAGYRYQYGNQCIELPMRVLSYLEFNGQRDDTEAYRALMKRIIPVGFVNCDPDWMLFPPGITRSLREYTAEEVQGIEYRFEGRQHANGNTFVQVRIINRNKIPIAAQSSIGKPILISWRFIDNYGKPNSGWENRLDLPLDIPANGDLVVLVPINPKYEIKSGTLEVSVVQEGVFWAHDVGVEPLRISWD